MSETTEKMVTLHLTEHQAEALYCLLRLGMDIHRVYNNTNTPEFLIDAEEAAAEAAGGDEGAVIHESWEDEEICYLDNTRLVAALQLWQQLPQEVKNRHSVVRNWQVTTPDIEEAY
jgi:hypothetical protein